MAAQLRWRHGYPVESVDGPLRALLLVDNAHGPVVERSGGRTVICHGSAPGPVSELRHATGRFAALEWDGRVLRAIRDPLGTVPLFYRVYAGAVWFATEIPALAALGGVVPDLEALAATAMTLPFPDRTGWEGVLRVLPGEIVEVDRSMAVCRTRYWHPASLFARYRGSSAQAEVDFRRFFQKAVCRARGNTTGILLSGGLDSSAVAVVSARLAPPQVRDVVVSVRYPSLPVLDESRYANAVTEVTSAPLHWVDGPVDRWDPRTETLALGVPSLGLPTGSRDSAMPEFLLHGCDVVLDGHDGDGVLGYAYANLGTAILDRRLGLIWQTARQTGWRLLGRALMRDFVPPPLRLRRLRGHPSVAEERARIRPYFTGRLRARYLAELDWRPPRSGWRRQQLSSVLPPLTQALEELEAEGARFGIDARHPFADRELVEFLISLPASIKTSPLRTKPILRDALSDLLPTAVRLRSDKIEFTPLLDRRIDRAACLSAIEESAVRLPDVDYARLFSDVSGRDGEIVTVMRLARAHVFASGAVP
jgi:asparagine synthase (glutamine-hydrolysing)